LARWDGCCPGSCHAGRSGMSGRGECLEGLSGSDEGECSCFGGFEMVTKYESHRNGIEMTCPQVGLRGSSSMPVLLQACSLRMLWCDAVVCHDKHCMGAWDRWGTWSWSRNLQTPNLGCSACETELDMQQVQVILRCFQDCEQLRKIQMRDAGYPRWMVLDLLRICLSGSLEHGCHRCDTVCSASSTIAPRLTKHPSRASILDSFCFSSPKVA